MSTSHNCPICYRQTNICSCGYAHSLPQETSTKSGALPVILFSLFLIAAFVHSVNWNQYFMTIIPLKMKEMVGVAKPTELKEIAKICRERKKMACEVRALEKAFALDAKEFKVLGRAGEIHMQTKNYDGAIRVYGQYFKAGAKDRDARYNLALALKNAGYAKDAKKQFQYLVKTEAKDPNYDIAREYVELLMGEGDLKAARDVIAKYRGFRKSAGYFLEKEWNFIDGRLGNGTEIRTATTQKSLSPFDN